MSDAQGSSIKWNPYSCYTVTKTANRRSYMKTLFAFSGRLLLREFQWNENKCKGNEKSLNGGAIEKIDLWQDE